ncbi:MAG: hypothetical protein HC866_04180 [Leptolyngbyaceae cyanobacterium RU_5_1]|nr:hypothetical protein [Leptolyngbyaceae cyanobacterium RU_5_1]
MSQLGETGTWISGNSISDRAIAKAERSFVKLPEFLSQSCLSSEAWEILHQLSEQHDTSISVWIKATARLLEKDQQLVEQVHDLLQDRLEKVSTGAIATRNQKVLVIQSNHLS